MYQNSLFPLRTIVGKPIPIKKDGIKQISESPTSKKTGINYDFQLNSSIFDTVLDVHYSNLLTKFIVNGKSFTFGEGMNTLPIPPPQRPFENDSQVISFFAFSQKPSEKEISRSLSVKFQIELSEKRLVGGICFGGFPYSPYLINDGQINTNFGLPREVRVTCQNRFADEKDSGSFSEFLDAEISATKQEIVSDSGFNFLCIEPTLTDVLTVNFSDFPTYFVSDEIDAKGQEKLIKHYGFAIPYFYVFEYQEKTRYRPTVSGGVLGLRTKTNVNRPSFISSHEYKYIVEDGNRGNYFDFTAASIFGQQRNYTVRDEFFNGKKPKGKVNDEFEECFISRKIKPDKSLILYIEQGEEFERCIAGLKMFMPFIPEKDLKKDILKLAEDLQEFAPLFPEPLDNLDEDDFRNALETWIRKFLKIPAEVDFCEKIGIRVFEIDPTEGVSPINVGLDSKYATLLAELEIDDVREIALSFYLEGIKFFRPSNAKYFAIEFTNLDNKDGQFVVKSLKFVQSAHVSVHPRASKTQQIKTLNFRIIGSDLAEDYALLGDEGFNFSIERLVAGERKSVLFKANSLMDLLHTGVAKIFNNVRRRAVEFEKSEVYPAFENDAIKYLIPQEYELDGGYKFSDNYEKRHSESRLEGWRKSETGDAVNGKNSWIGRNKPSTFENYGSQEARNYVGHLYPESTYYDGLKGWSDFLSSIIDSNVEFVVPAHQKPLDDNFQKYWRGIEVPKIRGLRQFASSPFSARMKEGIAADFGESGIDTGAVDDFRDDPTFDNFMKIFRTNRNRVQIRPLGVLTGGMNSSVSGNFGFNLFGANLGGGISLGFTPLPILTRNATFGSQGSITKQASKTGYSYSQFLNNSFDEGENYSKIDGGEMKRVVTRKEVPKTDNQRIRGSEVMWQGKIVDIISGAIPLNFELPATAGKIHFRTADDSLRVRFGSGIGHSILVDFWFDITEEIIRDDY